MTPARWLAALVVAAVAVSCTPFRVAYDFDPSADFGALRSYAWLPGLQPPTGDPRVDNSIVDSRIRAAVDTRLAAMGYAKDFPERADFLVAYHAAVAEKIDVETIDRYYGPGPRWAGVVVTDTVVTEYEEGTLLLDVVDRGSRKLLWRGSVQARLDRQASPAERSGRVQVAVDEMLARFPPPETRAEAP